MTDTTQTAQLRATVDTAGAKTGARISGSKLKQVALGLAVIAGIFGGADYARYYWTTGRYLVATDDAYVDAHSAVISPKISGYLADVAVDDNQPVKAGSILARIDPRDYQTALDQAR